jgi:isocitrate/isopropylmalate dehydrogenase
MATYRIAVIPGDGIGDTIRNSPCRPSRGYAISVQSSVRQLFGAMHAANVAGGALAAALARAHSRRPSWHTELRMVSPNPSPA